MRNRLAVFWGVSVVFAVHAWEVTRGNLAVEIYPLGKMVERVDVTVSQPVAPCDKSAPFTHMIRNAAHVVDMTSGTSLHSQTGISSRAAVNNGNLEVTLDIPCTALKAAPRNALGFAEMNTSVTVTRYANATADPSEIDLFQDQWLRVGVPLGTLKTYPISRTFSDFAVQVRRVSGDSAGSPEQQQQNVNARVMICGNDYCLKRAQLMGPEAQWVIGGPEFAEMKEDQKVEFLFIENAPLVVAESYHRTLELSFWSGALSVQDEIEVVNHAAGLADEFNRVPFSAMKSGRPAEPFRGFNRFWHQGVAYLPKNARNIDYRDDIGNISSSMARRDGKNGITPVVLQPRYPVSGQWTTSFELSYSLRSTPGLSYIFTSNQDGAVRLEVPILPVLHSVFTPEYKVELLLPVGSGEPSVISCTLPILQSKVEDSGSRGWLEPSWLFPRGRRSLRLDFAPVLFDGNVTRYQSDRLVVEFRHPVASSNPVTATLCYLGKPLLLALYLLVALLLLTVRFTGDIKWRKGKGIAKSDAAEATSGSDTQDDGIQKKDALKKTQ